MKQKQQMRFQQPASPGRHAIVMAACSVIKALYKRHLMGINERNVLGKLERCPKHIPPPTHFSRHADNTRQMGVGQTFGHWNYFMTLH